MSQIKPEYEPLKEFRTIAEKLVSLHPSVLDGVKPESITCYSLTNKDPKDGKDPFSIKAVDYPLRLDCPFDYYIIINGKAWDDLSMNHKAAMVMKILCSIDKEEPGKLVPYDLKDHAVLNRTLGPDYLQSPTLPNLLEDTINWKH